MTKRMYRSRSNRVIGGVAGVFADYMGVDATLLRLALVVAFVLTGFFPIGLFYIIAWAIIPRAESAY